MSKDPVAYLNERMTPFGRLIGLEFVEASKERVVATMLVRPELCTFPEILHGGAVMALADNVGAAAAVMNLKDGERTTTLESKTNFLAGLPAGQTARAEATAIHVGRTTMVWQTRITREDGRLAAVVTQTQMVLRPS